MEPSQMKTLQCPNCGAPANVDSVRCAYCQSVLTATACPSCFAPVFKGMKFCPACGAPVEHETARSDRTRSCPRCDKPLLSVAIAGTSFQECSYCGGIWLDTATFEKICADRDMQATAILYPSPASGLEQESATPKRYYVPCPECGELMNRKNFADCSGIVIDVCKLHGIWLDRLELQRIVRFIQDGGLQKARDNQLAQIQAEQVRLKDLQHERPEEALAGRDIPLFRDMSDDVSLVDLLAAFARKLIQ